MCRQEYTCIQFDKGKCALDKQGHNWSVFPDEINGKIHRQKTCNRNSKIFFKVTLLFHRYRN